MLVTKFEDPCAQRLEVIGTKISTNISISVWSVVVWTSVCIFTTGN